MPAARQHPPLATLQARAAPSGAPPFHPTPLGPSTHLDGPVIVSAWQLPGPRIGPGVEQVHAGRWGAWNLWNRSASVRRNCSCRPREWRPNSAINEACADASCALAMPAKVSQCAACIAGRRRGTKRSQSTSQKPIAARCTPLAGLRSDLDIPSDHGVHAGPLLAVQLVETPLSRVETTTPVLPFSLDCEFESQGVGKPEFQGMGGVRVTACRTEQMLRGITWKCCISDEGALILGMGDGALEPVPPTSSQLGRGPVRPRAGGASPNSFKKESKHLQCMYRKSCHVQLVSMPFSTCNRPRRCRLPPPTPPGRCRTWSRSGRSR